MSHREEFVGVRVIDIADYDGKGNHRYSMWLRTDEPIVRCRDCEHFGMFQPNKRYNASPSCCKFQITLPDRDGFCKWGEQKHD